MFFLALTVEAQNAERIKNSSEKKSSYSTERKSSNHLSEKSTKNQSRVATENRSTTPISTRNNTLASRRPDVRQEVKNDKQMLHSNSSMASRSRTSNPVADARKSDLRKSYTSNYGTRVQRVAPKTTLVVHSKNYKPYRKPSLSNLFWNVQMYRNYRLWYPDFNFGYYPSGYQIHTVSAFDSYRYIGEVARIYGRVSEVWYSGQTNEYYLYFGDRFPYHQFSIVLQARDAKQYSYDPIRYFTNRDLLVTGLVSIYDQKPEIFIKENSQIKFY